MHTVLILNPTSGSSTMATNENTPEENKDTLAAALRQHNIEPEIWYTTPEDPGDGLAKRAVREGVELVIAAGGDGTIHAVASGLIGTKSTLGIIAMGTMNNLARSLGIPEEIEEACAVIANGKTGQIDVGNINGHVFLEVAGLGIEAALFPAAEEIKRSGWLSTVQGAFKGLFKLFSFKPTRFSVSFDEHRISSFRAVQISVCNAPYYGAKLQFAPTAVMDDGLLDVLIYRNFSKFEYIRHAISISQGRRPFEPKVLRRKIKTINVTSANPVEIHADGLPHGHTPATVTVMPGVLGVRVPEKTITGPNMESPEAKETHHRQQAKRSNPRERQKEEGPLHVK